MQNVCECQVDGGQAANDAFDTSHDFNFLLIRPVASGQEPEEDNDCEENEGESPWGAL